MGDQGYTYTLDEAISTIGFGSFQLIVLAYAGLGWVAEAMEMMLLSFVGPAIQPEWGLSILQVKRREFDINCVVFRNMNKNHVRVTKLTSTADLEIGTGPFGSELPENDKSDAEVESAIGPIGNEALEYDNCDSEVVTKKKTKRGIGPFGSELPENDKSDAEVESAIGPIGNEALEYDNCGSEVVTKKKTKRDDLILAPPSLKSQQYHLRGCLALEVLCTLGQFQFSNQLDAALVEYIQEMITRHFYMAVDQAAKKLGVGLSSLKRQCRAMGIKRWPCRKLNSLQELIKHFQDENAGENFDPNTQEIIRRLEFLKRHVEENPDFELPINIKKLRQRAFKAKYKKKEDCEFGIVLIRSKRSK
ncbi:hypothetical protein CTI12_AA431040 [Artemisia annua]|uniref:RWP-RK domain-containing protein n=1 Tax=Artemisia annua TaxID=35608 RepID=A0A2U1M0L7_ARTAN|nr:hypothetical protein CTI12_AA431040 [Artemisia annua]